MVQIHIVETGHIGRVGAVGYFHDGINIKLGNNSFGSIFADFFRIDYFLRCDYQIFCGACFVIVFVQHAVDLAVAVFVGAMNVNAAGIGIHCRNQHYFNFREGTFNLFGCTVFERIGSGKTSYR
ncbi:MAG: hypothetical protein A4E71_01652 [Smithella sp. PtaU1.Bin162]|nr:MAG: hypothetical protein A4E71_01652 [Smithella sp. PtaU1.Bin162]